MVGEAGHVKKVWKVSMSDIAINETSLHVNISTYIPYIPLKLDP
jgi:hypothetical protein